MTIFVRGRVEGEFAQVDVYATVQIMLVVLAFLVMFLSGKLLSVWSQTARTSLRPLLIYSIICAISAVWSALPEFSLYRGVEYLVMLMAVVAALSCASTFEKAERTVLIVSFLVILMTIYLNFKTKQFGMTMKFWHTNSYSASAAMVFVYCVGEYFRSKKPRRRWLRIGAVLALMAAIAGTSAASYLAILCGLLVLALIYRNKLLVVLGSIVLIGIMAVNVFSDIDISVLFPYLFPGKTESEIIDLGGRRGTWEPMWLYFLESPIVGRGFAIISTGQGQLIAAATHNSIFSVLTGTGTVGMITVLVYGFRLAREFLATTVQRLPGAVGCAGALITGLANSTSMPLVFSEWEESSVVFAAFTAIFLLFVLIPYRDTRAKQHSSKMRILPLAR